MLFLLRLPTKAGYRDVLMQAQYFFLRGKGESVLPVMKKEGKGKGKWTIGPRMKNGRENLCSDYLPHSIQIVICGCKLTIHHTK